MEYQPSDLINQRRDSKKEQNCAKYLRNLGAEERADFLWPILKTQENMTQLLGCQLVAKTMYERDFLIDMLDYGLSNCDVSSIKFWLRAIVKNLGPKKTIYHLISRINDFPDLVGASCYHLNFILEERTENVNLLFKKLQNKCKDSGIPF